MQTIKEISDHVEQVWASLMHVRTHLDEEGQTVCLYLMVFFRPLVDIGQITVASMGAELWLSLKKLLINYFVFRTNNLN